MRRLALILLVAAGCNRSPVAGPLAEKMKQMDGLSRQRLDFERETRPLEAQMKEAKAKGDRAAAARVHEQLEPLKKRHLGAMEREQKLAKEILDLAASALEKNPDDVDVL